MLKSLICPVSPERMDASVVRLTGLMVVFLTMTYLVTGWYYVLVFVTVDYFLRTFSFLGYSPISGFSLLLARMLSFPRHDVPKAPKWVAARVGAFLGFGALWLMEGYPTISYLGASILCFLAFLESAMNFCVGAALYRVVVREVKS